MPSKNPTTGDPVQARCTKCRKITTHTVVTMADELPATVQCSKCQHTSAARKPVDRRVVDPKKSAREEWATLRPDMDISRAQAYSMTGAYKTKALVNHPIFGLGLVQKLSGLQKMVVLFADGEKVMRCK
jgi:NAD-dependent SIR2 family protein deacetylase